jgi:ribonuclease/clavin/mitogillin
MIDFEGELVIGDAVRVLPLRTPTLPPATHTNACLLGTGGDAIVVEPATPHDDERARMLEWLRHHEARGTRITAIVLTHHHVDHVGAADWLRAELGVPLLAHALTEARLQGEIAIDRTIADGDVLALDGPRALAIDVLHTPGHAPGHVCLWEPVTRTLIAGDMVAGTGTILVEPTDGDVGLYLASLARLAALEPRVIVPAHGAPLEKEVLPRYIAHRRAREAKILAALRALGGARGIDEIVPVAYADTHPAAWPYARLATEAHLIELAKHGTVSRDDERWAAR